MFLNTSTGFGACCLFFYNSKCFSLRGGDENRGLCVEKYSFASDNIGDYDRLILKTVASNMVNLRLRN